MPTSTHKIPKAETATLRPPGARAEPRRPPVANWLRRIREDLDIAGEIVTPSGELIRLGVQEPRFRIKFHRADLLKRPQDEFSLGQAYVNGDIDFEGDMLALLDRSEEHTSELQSR